MESLSAQSSPLEGLQERSTVLVRQLVAAFRAGNRYEVLDPATGNLLARVEEDVPSLLVKFLKFTKFKTLTPFTVQVLAANGTPLLTMKRGWTFLVSRVEVLDGRGQLLGSYKQRLLSIGGKLELLDRRGEPLGLLAGNIVGWTFTFTSTAGQELAVISRKWSGLGKELLTSADNYAVEMKPQLRDPTLKALILAGAFCVDMVYKNETRGMDLGNLLSG